MSLSLSNRIIRAAFERQGSLSGRVVAFVFFGMFLAGGILVFVQTFVRPLMGHIGSGSWERVEANLKSIGLSQHGDDDEEIAVRYEYEYGGEYYSGDRFSHSTVDASFGDSTPTHIFSEYRVEEPVMIWVNPEDPADSVLERKLRWTNFLGLFFPIPFFTAGLAGVGWAIFGKAFFRRSVRLRSEAADRCGSESIAACLRNPARWPDENESVLFLDGEERSGGLVILGACLFWNGILGTFGIALIMMFLAGDSAAWWMALFLVPFELIGAVLAWAVWRGFTSARPPDYVIVSSPVLPDYPEMQVTVEWAYLGNEMEFSAVTELELVVVRSSGNNLFRKNRKRKEPLETTGLVVMSETDPSLRHGTATFTLEAIDQKSFFGGRLKADFSGGIELILRWKLRNFPHEETRFTLGSAGEDG